MMTNLQHPAPTPRRNAGGFTLLEVMVTLAIVGGALVLVLGQRESAMLNSYQARNANRARDLARELLSELEVHELRQLSGKWERYLGFTYEIEITEEDLLTGEEEDEEDKKNENGSKFSDTSRFADSIDPSAEEEEDEYPVRRIKLTIRYPNLRDTSDKGEPMVLEVETIFPALPDDEKDSANPFGTKTKK